MPTLISSGWASGVNAYLTVALLSLAGRAGWGDVPESLQSDGVLAAALVLFAIEFVADKVPYVDNAWDAVHTAVRPAIASALGVGFAGDAGSTGPGGGAVGGRLRGDRSGQPRGQGGPTPGGEHLPRALLQHLREPDRGRAGGRRDLLAIEHPVPAAVIAVMLLVGGDDAGDLPHQADTERAALLQERLRGATAPPG